MLQNNNETLYSKEDSLARNSNKNERFIYNSSFPYNIIIEDLINSEKELNEKIEIGKEAYDITGNLLPGTVALWINESVKDEDVYDVKQFYFAELRKFERFAFVRQFKLLVQNISQSQSFYYQTLDSSNKEKDELYIRGYISPSPLEKEERHYIGSNENLVYAIREHYKRIYDLLKQNYYNEGEK